MSIEAMSFVMSVRLGSPVRKLVALVLADSAGFCDHSPVSFLSTRDLARLCEITTAEARSALLALIEAGLIERDESISIDGRPRRGWRFRLPPEFGGPEGGAG